MKNLTLFFFVLITHSFAQAAFQEGYKNPHDLLYSIKLKFDGLPENRICGSLRSDDRATLGDMNLLTGESASSTPGVAFIAFIDSCVQSYTQSLDDNNKSSEWLKTVFPTLLGAKSDSDIQAYLYSYSWIQNNAETDQIIKDLVFWFLGTDDEILSYGRMQDPNIFREDIKKFLLNKYPYRGTFFSSGINEIAKILVKRDEFLLYR